MFKKISGTRDILPEEAVWWQKIEASARRIFSLYNFQEIRPPLVEEEALFNRSLGESTEIIQKQMFIIRKGNDVYALRPEATASVVRAYLENSLDKKEGFSKFYYLGPMFRLERPQKGRLRQFHHVGCEAIGSYDPTLDVEVISLASALLEAFSVSGYEIKINSLGCPKDKRGLAESLRQKLKSKLSDFCQDCQARFNQNVLRILDCKQETCKKLIHSLDIKDNHLCPECKGHFSEVKAGLDRLNIKYDVDYFLVRGLDYYTRTVFEIKHNQLGSQDALGAGGRYDNLVKELGGTETGAIGFAFGMERLLLASCECLKEEKKKGNLIFFISLGEEAKRESLKLMQNLRQAGYCCDTDYEARSLKGAMRLADSRNARYVLIIGEDELKKSMVTVKDMETGKQAMVSFNDLTRGLIC